jgi:hypothetical protein
MLSVYSVFPQTALLPVQKKKKKEIQNNEINAAVNK